MEKADDAPWQLWMHQGAMDGAGGVTWDFEAPPSFSAEAAAEERFGGKFPGNWDIKC